MRKPTIVVVPGAFIGPEHLEPFLSSLLTLGYPISTGILPCNGSEDPKSETVSTSTAYIRDELLMPALNRGEDIVLVLHSFAGIAGGTAAYGLSKEERKRRGERGGLLGLVYVAAFVVEEGTTQGMEPVEMPGSWVEVNKETGELQVPNPKLIFFNNVDPILASSLKQHIQPLALTTLITPSGPQAWTQQEFHDHGRLAFVLPDQDNALRSALQETMMQESGVEWRVLRLEGAGHLPFLSHTEEMARFVDGLAEEWAG